MLVAAWPIIEKKVTIIYFCLEKFEITVTCKVCEMWHRICQIFGRYFTYFVINFIIISKEHNLYMFCITKVLILRVNNVLIFFLSFMWGCRCLLLNHIIWKYLKINICFITDGGVWHQLDSLYQELDLLHSKYL